MKIRFAFVNGIWQLCMVTAAFRQEQRDNPNSSYKDCLILYTRQTASSELANFTKGISDKFWNWQGVTLVDWTTSTWNRQQPKDEHPSVKKILEVFNLDEVSSVDEIWLCKIQFLDERLFADIFFNADIILYEDGLHTYAPTKNLVEPPAISLINLKTTIFSYQKLAKDLLSGQIDWKHEGIKNTHLRRVKQFYSILGTQIPIPEILKKVPLTCMDSKLLRTFFSELNNRLECPPLLSETQSYQKKALLLGSNLSHLQTFPRHKEVAVFVDLINELVQQGYTILWKEHPRNQEPLIADIRQTVNSKNIVYLSNEQKIPIEILVSENKIDLCCSTLSSSLFYLRYIYGINTTTCVEPLLPFLRGDFHRLSELTLTHIGHEIEVYD